MEIGPKIRTVRNDLGLSQSEVEKRTGIKREYLSKIENTELKNPTINTLTNIVCNGLNMTLIDFFEYPDNGHGETRRKRQSKVKVEMDAVDVKISVVETEVKNLVKILNKLYAQKQILVCRLSA